MVIITLKRSCKSAFFTISIIYVWYSYNLSHYYYYKRQIAEIITFVYMGLKVSYVALNGHH